MAAPRAHAAIISAELAPEHRSRHGGFANGMPASDHHQLLLQIAADFDALARRLEHALEDFANDDSGTVDIAALTRARDAASRGSKLARDAFSGLRRAFH